MKGAKGPKGPKGPKEPKGPKGPKGGGVVAVRRRDGDEDGDADGGGLIDSILISGGVGEAVVV